MRSAAREVPDASRGQEAMAATGEPAHAMTTAPTPSQAKPRTRNRLRPAIVVARVSFTNLLLARVAVLHRRLAVGEATAAEWSQGLAARQPASCWRGHQGCVGNQFFNVCSSARADPRGWGGGGIGDHYLPC